jgi:hypothetical protein
MYSYKKSKRLHDKCNKNDKCNLLKTKVQSTVYVIHIANVHLHGLTQHSNSQSSLCRPQIIGSTLKGKRNADTSIVQRFLVACRPHTVNSLRTLAALASVTMLCHAMQVFTHFKQYCNSMKLWPGCVCELKYI